MLCTAGNGFRKGLDMEKVPFYMVMDVESIGLFGPAFALGFVVMDEGFRIVQEEYSCCGVHHFTRLSGSPDFEWVEKNVVPHCPVNEDSPHSMMAEFITAWTKYQPLGCQLWADCCFPVETNFLSRVLDQDEHLRGKSPYPLYDLATLLFARGYDPTRMYPRREDELPAHHPLMDARQSARILKSLLLGTGTTVDLVSVSDIREGRV